MILEREIEVALAAARTAGDSALAARRRGSVDAESKSDDSPVTEIDRQNERIITGALMDAFPDDGLLGEEGASRDGSSGRRWIIDPIDGTRDFIRGLLGWSVMIGLEAGDDIELGVIYFPALELMYSARRGAGAWCNGERLRVSLIDSVSRAVICPNGLKFLPGTSIERTLQAFVTQFWAVRTFGGALDAMWVASGRAEVFLEPKMMPWDMAAMKVILEEAGARFFAFSGRETIYEGNCAACAPGLEAHVRRFLGC